MGKIALLFCLSIIVILFGFGNGAESDDADKQKNEKIGFYELKKGNVSMKFSNWGATMVSFILPDKNGKPIDIILGYDTIKEYQNDTTYFGAIVGRVANRIGRAQFKLNGTLYKLVPNEGKNMLHGGPKGYSDLVWKVSSHKNTGHAPHIVFTYHSCDGEEGFPGKLRVSVMYTLIAQNELAIVMKAKNVGTKASPVSLAQHSYWNLGGQNSGIILSEKIQIFASKYTPVDSELIPTGKILPVNGTPYDFQTPEKIGSRIKQLAKGYDINYALDGGKKLKKAAFLKDRKSGLKMELFTNAPGLQFYTGNLIDNVKGKDGFVYQAHAGLCLETQFYPDFVNHPNFPQSIVEPGQVYRHIMIYKFST